MPSNLNTVLMEIDAEVLFVFKHLHKFERVFEKG